MNTITVFINKIKTSTLAKDSFWTIFGSGIGKGLSLIAGIFVARFLGSVAYGQYGTIRTTLIYIAIVSTFGFGYTATKFVAQSLENSPSNLKSLIQKLLYFTSIFSVVLSFIFIFYADKIAIALKATTLGIILKRYSILIVLNAIVSTQIAIISGFKMFKEASIVNIWSGCIVFFTSIIFTLLWQLNGAIIALLVSFAIQAIMNQRIINKAVSALNVIAIPFKWTDFVSIIKFSIPISLQESLYTIVHWASLWLLIKYSNYTQVGISSAGSLWQSMVIFIPSMLKNVMFSYFTTSKDSGLLRNKLILVNFISTTFPVLIITVFSCFISKFYGATYAGIQPVIIVCISSSIFISIAEVYCYKLISTNHAWLVFTSRCIRDLLILLAASIVYQQVSSLQALYWSVISLIGNIIYLIVIFFLEKRITR